MKWFRRKKHPPPKDGQAARRRAYADLATAEARWPEVNRVAESLRDLRERNHFALQVRMIFQGENK
jgi:hypothetical protein